MKNAKKRRTSRERRVLIVALLLAVAIVTGSTFAWFTSKDEVTNRLTASAEYGVAIAENFEPPETWVPGQEINKDVSAVNTGNVDAFVRMWLDGNMRILSQNKTATTTAQWSSSDAFGTALTGTANVTDSNIISLGLTEYKDDSGNFYYFKTLDKTQTLNPNVNAGTNANGYGGNSATGFSGAYSEVQAMQGSRLAYAPTDASYAFVLKEETRLPVYLSEDSKTADDVEVTVPAGTLVIVNASSKVESTITNGVFAPYGTDDVKVTSASGAEYTSNSTVYVSNSLPILTNIEYESFTPFTDGLYLFLRNENGTSVTDPEFSGYYVTGLTPDDMNSSAGTYYALNTNTGGANRSDYTVKGATTATVDAPVQVTFTDGVITAVTPTTNLELFNATYATVPATSLIWRAAAVDTTNKKQTIYAIYDKSQSGTADNAFTAADDIVVEITLANIDSAAEAWKSVGNANTVTAYTITDSIKPAIDASALTFYYNNDVEAGDTSAKLVDKVKLYDGVTNQAYLAFDFDLNVHLESVQVTFDENGNEKADAVSSGWAATLVSSSAVNTAATGTPTPAFPSGEITSIAWSTT